MPLDPATDKRIRAEAAKRGADPDAAVARAEELAAERAKAEPVGPRSTEQSDPATSGAKGQILVGFLPFFRVRELRFSVGYTERIPDDEMMCGAFAAKYGGAGSPATSPPAEEPSA